VTEYQTEAEAQQAAEQFQALLGLSHWSIKVRFADDLKTDYANVFTNENKRHALIRLATREAYLKSSAGQPMAEFSDFDHERTLIHELLHLLLAPLDPLIEPNPLSAQIIETAVHSISITIKNLLDAARRSSAASVNSADNSESAS
jgi:hypothetical protein